MRAPRRIDDKPALRHCRERFRIQDAARLARQRQRTDHEIRLRQEVVQFPVAGKTLHAGKTFRVRLQPDTAKPNSPNRAAVKAPISPNPKSPTRVSSVRRGSTI